jgi:hypothetical protein
MMGRPKKSRAAFSPSSMVGLKAIRIVSVSELEQEGNRERLSSLFEDGMGFLLLRESSSVTSGQLRFDLVEQRV